MVSFSFDDVPDSAYSNGARLLDAHGLKGTFYIAPGICSKVEDHWRLISRQEVADLSARGHEIGCHTYAHVAVQRLTAQELYEDDQHCRSELRAICGDIVLRSFAFPFGNTGLLSKLRMQNIYATCRGIHVGINRGVVDLGLLKVQELYDSTSMASIEALLDDVERHGGWLIFYSHDIAEPASFIGCSPKLLDQALAAVRRRAIACLSVGDAAEALGLA